MFFNSRTGQQQQQQQQRGKLTSHLSLAGKNSNPVAMEKRMQYKQNKNVFPNVSTQRRRGHEKLQPSLSAEGYLEPTISGVCEPNSRLSVSGNPSSWQNKSPTGAGGAFSSNNLRSPLLAIRSVSAEHNDCDFNASDALAERHSYHGSSRALVREASPDPPRFRSPSPYSSANPPPPPIRTTPSQPSGRASPLPPEVQQGSSEKVNIQGLLYKPAPPQRLSPLTLHADYKEVRENMEKVNSVDSNPPTQRARALSMGARRDQVRNAMTSQCKTHKTIRNTELQTQTQTHSQANRLHLPAEPFSY